MNFRPYDTETDRAAVLQIWREIHWLDRDDNDDERFLDVFLSECAALVAEVNGRAECLVTSVPGSILHQDTEIPLGIVSSVTTSLIARRRGLGSRLTAQLVAQEAAQGMAVSALGMFEQGYYSRLGFGTGPYEHKVRFNPAHLSVNGKAGVPHRLTEEDYRDVHDALIKRWRGHGSVQVFAPELTHAELGWTESPAGFGYRDQQGELTHFIWGEMKDEYGPFKINAMAYRNRQQLLELLALIRNLGDQIYAVRVIEPCHIQMQDVIREPFKAQNTTEGSKYPASNNAEAYWQIRINDLPACMAKTRLEQSESLPFNLRLTDPIAEYLPTDQAWRGVGGDYSVIFGPQCSAKEGFEADLPQLDATVAGFSRLWLGCAGANAIATAGEIAGPQELLDSLERVLALPLPKVGWDF